MYFCNRNYQDQELLWLINLIINFKKFFKKLTKNPLQISKQVLYYRYSKTVENTKGVRIMKKSFEEIREHVKAKADTFREVSPYLNEDGKIVSKVYSCLDEATCFADNIAEFVEEVRREICSQLAPAGFVHVSVAKARAEVADKLKKFVRHNVENELWESIPEFQN